MNSMLKSVCALIASLSLVSLAAAKLPAPSEEAKAKAAEAKAKAAWTGKVGAYQLCKSQDKVVAHYKKVTLPKEAKLATAAASSPPGACVDPGPFVYSPEASVTAPAASAVAPATKS